ncbi:CCA tRNA nucleotidyltransferase [Paenibacillus alvei]|uniref:CCA tRNA nucleotidyltransferase n=1 Tax=Paenibacillus alvei TaxID=44250 RepID=A0AAP6ZXF7_PAEAL|nr:CCA tRNA nucleotidyltransferase [Paenibacillus alvei]NOJ68998.1 CCA tRNA nucleotidyltransferase [Paenibacillus alvei]
MNGGDRNVDSLENKTLFEEAAQVMHCLLNAGFSAYMVGGCVRDPLIGRPVYDVDIATSARPEQVVALFRKVIPTGLQHGTVTVVMPQHTYEVTTFRKETAYEGHRRPEEVEFIDDLIEDLRRRDFTINAMAKDVHGHIHDPFGGQADLKQLVIRCVGTAEERFREDALRMMRGVRFASLLGGVFAKSTWRALWVNRKTLSFVAMERVRDELWKLTAGPNPARGWALLVRSGLLAHAKEPLGALASTEGALWQPLLCALGRVDTAEKRIALLLLGHEVDEAEAQRILQALRCSGAQQDAILAVLRADARLAAGGTAALAAAGTHGGAASAWRRPFAETLFAVGEQGLCDALACRRALLGVGAAGEHTAAMQPFLQHGEAWLEDISVRGLRDIALTGGEVLQATKRTAGPWLRQCLESVWLSVALGELANQQEVLLDYVRKAWNEQ